MPLGSRLRLAGGSGIAGALVFTAGWLFAHALDPSVEYGRDYISNFGAATGEHPWVWNAATAAAGILILLLLAGLARALPAHGMVGSASSLSPPQVWGRSSTASCPSTALCPTIRDAELDRSGERFRGSTELTSSRASSQSAPLSSLPWLSAAACGGSTGGVRLPSLHWPVASSSLCLP